MSLILPIDKHFHLYFLLHFALQLLNSNLPADLRLNFPRSPQFQRLHQSEIFLAKVHFLILRDI